MWLPGIVLYLFSVSASFALDCTQIFESDIRDKNTVYLPDGSVNYHPLQPLPANFNCTYRIFAPIGLYAFVNIENKLRGVNDFMIVTDITGQRNILNNRTGMNGETDFYYIVPGTQMSIQVTTKSVFMNSMILIEVDYYTASPGSTYQMKTGGDMNYLDTAKLKHDDNGFKVATIEGSEPIFVSLPMREFGDGFTCRDCFLIDGTFTNQTNLYSLCDIRSRPYRSLTTSTNSATIVCWTDWLTKFVFNPVSEYKKFYSILSLESPTNVPLWTSSRANSSLGRQAVEIVNFPKIGITFEGIIIHSDDCIAYVVSGPPNNSSEILLDLATAKFPHNFDLKYFSIVNEQCHFSFGIQSY